MLAEVERLLGRTARDAVRELAKRVPAGRACGIDISPAMVERGVIAKVDYKTIADEKFDGPLVGTGPYLLEEWKTGQFARFKRNPLFFAQEVPEAPFFLALQGRYPMSNLVPDAALAALCLEHGLGVASADSDAAVSRSSPYGEVARRRRDGGGGRQTPWSKRRRFRRPPG